MYLRNMGNSGIYLITNTVTKNRYVGSATHVGRRFNEHKSDLRHKKHHSQHLQKAWNKHGEDVFKFEVLAKCPKEYLIKLEQFFIDTLKPEYNILRKAGSPLGYKHTDEARKKISVLNKGRVHSEQSRINMSIGQKKSGISKKILAQFQKQRQKTVYQYTIDGIFIKKHDSVAAAAKIIGITLQAIAHAARGCGKSCAGFQWRYFFNEHISAIEPQTVHLAVYKEGKLVGAYRNITDAVVALNTNRMFILRRLAGKKTKKTVNNFTATKITYAEYKNLIQ